MILIAHNIRSLHNVGSLFRSADAFGVEKMYLTGYTGTPPRNEIHKTALGSEDHIPWEYREDVISVLHELRTSGYLLAGLETGKQTIPIQTFHSDRSIALFLGSEVTGIDPTFFSELDLFLSIPMTGRKQSLNVSVAAGIALFVLSTKT
ncbi:MAG: tRNA/rRNA methyltransferase (spou) [Candidatus Uhrbacteria bacterium GW2011_GWF2_41_16]|jgi:tRNA G18 (ribose-2'-O)-methylase SpoU|uniref:tRNA/rRNA methyltransferase (Spou) n=2 Tax=Candidatus Uhriibacteriota TaxID=1752732 RepID=A0A0G0XKY2_9BACT|nr:MAG: tRNA/rRNA methyltransferase (spou) [Candidatus Uhrbacteria bacterium GW2011_GWC2_41_11]KKR97430.1 MAG: tRNA/rRNA methyltransferase (spou) [Candidatus Uhrbacteria bacterium GW2011_GWF2_41_16]HBP00089.1 RNA methyltransferase [Candidatus Uhrbacteria bacterium]